MPDVPTSTVVRALVLGVVVAGTATFMHASKTVTVSVDGEVSQVQTYASTVAETLESQGVPVGDHDSVVPALSTKVGDGSNIVVRRGRPVVLTIDGIPRQLWTTAQTVDELTDTLGSRYDYATLTASRSQRIPLSGLSFGLSLPKQVTVVHDGKSYSFVTTATTVSEVLVEAGVGLGSRDLARPALERPAVDDMRIRVVRVTQRRAVERTQIPFEVRHRSDASLYRGVVKVLDSGRAGLRTTTYLVVRHDAKVVSRVRISARVLRAPRDRVVLVGTKTRPVSRTGVDGLNWTALARCESGGNPRAVGGGGIYFGLYQFTLGTWHSVGGSGNPVDASPAEQTYRAKQLYRSRGSQPWPVCGRMLYT